MESSAACPYPRYGMVGVSIPHLGFNRLIPSISFHRINFDAFVKLANAAAEWSEPPLSRAQYFHHLLHRTNR